MSKTDGARRGLLKSVLGLGALGAGAAACAPPVEPYARMDKWGAWRFASRTVPLPQSISPEARHFLAWRQPAMGDGPKTADAWRQALARSEAAAAPGAAKALAKVKADVEDIDLGEGLWVYVAKPRAPAQHAAQADRALLYMHGGGFLEGRGLACKAETAALAERTGVTVFGVDYRTGPDAPFPAALDDCVRAYEFALTRLPATSIVLYGGSAGGNLAVTCALRLRDGGKPAPAGVVALSPEADLTESGDSFVTNLYLDVVLGNGMPDSIAVYAGGADCGDPLLSPIFADYSKGFPRTLIQAGTRDLFLSNAVRLHRAMRAGDVEAELHIWEAMPHIGFGGRTPEDDEIKAEIGKFLEKCWSASA